ncbi:MAG: ribonuclease J [Clostridiales Family XIII bacterium]|jgi:ribonuclease J|nr:ribonuclease J [Clostridiales Family XIII bacterium]
MAIDFRKRNRGGERKVAETVAKTAVKQTSGTQTSDKQKSGNRKRSTKPVQETVQPEALEKAAPSNPNRRNSKNGAVNQNHNAGGERKGQNRNRNNNGQRNGQAPPPNPAPPTEGALEIIPIGGLGEIGKNMTAFRYGGEILIVDCGMAFPDEEMYGVDVVIPDFAFLEENAAAIKAVVVTHGHEDHIGATPFFLKRFKVPVYGTRLTLGLIESKLKERGVKGDLRQIKAGEKLKIGKFRIETIRATHSIADSVALAIETPAGTVFHSGDFKIDYTPIDGDPMDFQKLAEIGHRGIDLMLCDSTNALRKGFSESEKKLDPILDDIFRNTQSRILIATFASNVHRVQTIINTAVKHKRKIALSGRSMLKVMELAVELGYLTVPPGTLVDLDQTKDIPDKKLVVITTGSQGEPMSALSRMASREHRSVHIKFGDMVILSSSPIPGNEKTISHVVNSLLGQGAQVIYSDIADIHVSGHASEEEIKILISLLRPKNYFPVHGENKHLLKNAAIAEDLGIPKGNIIIAANGNVIELKNGAAKLTRRTVPAEPVFVDGLGVGDIGTTVLRDRKQLSEAGLIIVTAAIDPSSGFVVSGPEVSTRGFIYEKMSGSSEIVEEIRQTAQTTLENFERKGMKDVDAVKAAIRGDLKNLIYARTQRNPVIIPILVEA